MHWLRLAWRLAWERAGSSNPARIATTATTMRSSIKLNPWRELHRHGFLGMLVVVRYLRFSSRGATLIFPSKSQSWRVPAESASVPSNAERMQLQCAFASHRNGVFVESPLSRSRMHPDHEPSTGETATRRCCRHRMCLALDSRSLVFRR